MLKNTLYDFEKGKKIIKEAMSKFPSGSGVYKFLDVNNKPLYIGKAKNLKKRISSYINSSKQPYRIRSLICLTCNIGFIKTPTELDSFLLENNLIKELKPKFNIRLMDDKSYPYIMISKKSDWPRIRKFRGKQNKNDTFFGPFANVNAVDNVLKQLEKAFLIRSCSDAEFNNRKRPCILYQIKRCSAPCVGLISKKNYLDLVSNAIMFLKGKNSLLKNELIKKMRIESKKENYEMAASIRDRIKALTKISNENHSDLNNSENFDVICCIKKYEQFCIQIFFFRSGKNLGNKEFFYTENIIDDPKIILSQFLIFFYSKNTAPREILINHSLKEINVVSSIISKNTKYIVKIKKPDRGKKLSILNMVEDNIAASLKDHAISRQETSTILKNISNILGLNNFPFRIEIYDNSHLSGSNPVGAMVVFENNSFLKKSYRKFNIISDNERLNDDYFMLSQMLNRRFTLTTKWKNYLPNLIIIDGGKGHLNVAYKSLKEKKIENIDIISIAKGKNRNAGNETIYSKNHYHNFNTKDKELFFLQRLRDEAHRFAITSQKIRRSRSLNNSVFDCIKGVGKKMKSNLLSYFGSIENIKTASLQDLKKTPGIGEKIAIIIYKEFNKIV